jgi:hypothetical protein
MSQSTLSQMYTTETQCLTYVTCDLDKSECQASQPLPCIKSSKLITIIATTDSRDIPGK